MPTELIPVGGALIASLMALFISLRNREWIKQDREADRLAAARHADLQRQLDAELATRRKAAEQAFELLPSNCTAWVLDVSRHEPDMVAAVRSGLATVEPIRHLAFALPLPWRLRIDCMASYFGHFPRHETGAILRQDLVDLLNGRESPSPLDDDFGYFFMSWVWLVVSGERYIHDPLTRDLGAQLRESRMNSWRPISQRTDDPEVRALFGTIVGRPVDQLPCPDWMRELLPAQQSAQLAAAS